MSLLFLASMASADDVRTACRDLVLDYAFYRDRPDAQAVANLFTEDATLSVLGTTYDGRAAIRKRLEGAEEGPSFRHLMSTIRIFPETKDTATGVSYVTVYSAAPGVSTVAGFLAIGEYHDEFRRTAEGWKIKARRFVPVYEHAATAPGPG